MLNLLRQSKKLEACHAKIVSAQNSAFPSHAQLKRSTFGFIIVATLLLVYIGVREVQSTFQQNTVSDLAVAQAVATLESQMLAPAVPLPVPATAIPQRIVTQPDQVSVQSTIEVIVQANVAATINAELLEQSEVFAVETGQAIAVEQARATAVFETRATAVVEINTTVAAYREQYDSLMESQVFATVQAAYVSDVETVREAGASRLRAVVIPVFTFILGGVTLAGAMVYFSKPKPKRRTPQNNALTPSQDGFVQVYCSCNGQSVVCTVCDGTGEILQQGSNGGRYDYYRCHYCQGHGRTICSRCQGDGKLYRKRTDLI